jgi:hypothetical protein
MIVDKLYDQFFSWSIDQSLIWTTKISMVKFIDNKKIQSKLSTITN